ncbi:MAG: hypothetical protein IT440_03215 [Phycisphaeraceae bacterium]|nr:hypothetical protein [Phycisphaeraceae bacterium]
MQHPLRLWMGMVGLAAILGLAALARADVAPVSVDPEHPEIGRTLRLVSPVNQNVHIYVINAGYIAFNASLQANVPYKLKIPTVTPLIQGIQTGGEVILGGQYVYVWNSSTWTTLATFTLSTGISIKPDCPQIGSTITLLSPESKTVHLFFSGINEYMAYGVQLQAGVPTVLTVPHTTPAVPQNNQPGGTPIADGEPVVIWALPNWTTVGNLTLTTDSRQLLDFTSFGTYIYGPLDFTVAGPDSYMINAFRTVGRRFIVQIDVFDAQDRYNITHWLPMLSDEAYESRVDAALAGLDLTQVYAVTLDEENGYWNEQQEILDHLYDYIKANYDVPVYQWYSPSAFPPGFGYPVLKADGWMSDEYWLGDGTDYASGFAAFEKYVRRYLVHGKPFVHMLWAAPDFEAEPYEGPLVFDEQLDVCRKYNVPVAFFAYAPSNDSWGWNSNAPSATQARWQIILQERLDALAVTDSERYARWDDVAPAEPVELVFSGATAVYEDDFTAVGTTPAKFMDDATITGFRDLLWNDAHELCLRAADDGERIVRLVYHFVSATAMANLAVTLTESTESEDAANTVEVSADGINWLPVSQISAFSNVTQFWVRVTMTVSQAAKGEITNTLTFFQVSASRAE